jgi:hypothetical protein
VHGDADNILDINEVAHLAAIAIPKAPLKEFDLSFL